jgi:CRISPR-associated protein Csb2
LRALRDAHAEKITGTGPGDPWQVGVGVDYVPQQSVVATTPTTDGPYGDMVVLRFESRRLDGRHAARVAAHIRAALLSRAMEHIATLHGHHDGSVVQVAFLPLPDVGHANADGHLLGVAIAVPPLPKRDLDVGATRGLDPQRWAGRAQDWVSVPPVVLDRYVRTDQAVVAEVIRAAVNAGLPEPQVLEVDRLPLLEGAPSLRPSDTLRRDDDRSGRPFRHVRLRFPGPISGPVVLGSMRHYGLGLCLPSPEPQ